MTRTYESLTERRACRSNVGDWFVTISRQVRERFAIETSGLAQHMPLMLEHRVWGFSSHAIFWMTQRSSAPGVQELALSRNWGQVKWAEKGNIGSFGMAVCLGQDTEFLPGLP